MRSDEHYGVIPGTKKPTLYQPGADVLCMAFQLAPSYTENMIDHPGGHREWQFKCRLEHKGALIAEGVGTASTLEPNWRYESDLKPVRPVPKDYWPDRGNRKAEYNRQGLFASKVGGQWMLCEKADKVECADPAKHWNTVRKMAAKRAYLHATIRATNSSGYFNHDLEDRVPPKPPEASQPPRPQPSTSMAQRLDQENHTFDPTEIDGLNRQSTPQPDAKMTQPQSKKLWASVGALPRIGNSPVEIRKTFVRYLMWHILERTKDFDPEASARTLTVKEASTLIDGLNDSIKRNSIETKFCDWHYT
jgi:hypothetical protein